MRSRRAVALACVVLLVAACGGSSDRGAVTGVVTRYEGDIAALEWFEVRLPGNDTPMRFEPEPGLTFDDGTPATHLFEHFLDGSAIRVTYRVEGDRNIAIRLQDG